MSKLNPTTGEILTIEDANANQVTFRLQANAEQRARYKANEMTEYETTKQDSRQVEVNLGVPADSTKSIVGNWITAGYVALNTLDEFATWVDC